MKTLLLNSEYLTLTGWAVLMVLMVTVIVIVNFKSIVKLNK